MYIYIYIYTYYIYICYHYYSYTFLNSWILKSRGNTSTFLGRGGGVYQPRQRLRGGVKKNNGAGSYRAGSDLLNEDLHFQMFLFRKVSDCLSAYYHYQYVGEAFV